MTHCFFASMGGFAIDTYPTGPNEREFIRGSPQITLTPRGVLFLAQHGCLPDITLKTINDKSKADHLTKGLALLQASWMIVQCIARLASRLPITLLEILTLGHVFCALIVYLFWWNKPLDVRIPLAIFRPQIRLMAAFLTRDGQNLDHPQEPKDKNPQHIADSARELASIQKEMAQEACSIFNLPLDKATDEMICLGVPDWDHNSAGNFWSVISGQSKFKLSYNRDDAIAWLSFALLSSCYGSLYVAAWFSHFPTPSEAILWKLSSLFVTSSSFVLGALYRMSYVLDALRPDPIHGTLGLLTNLLVLFLAVLDICAVGGVIVGYGFSRVFLVIEAFISIRSLQSTAYDTPNWTQWIPHL